MLERTNPNKDVQISQTELGQILLEQAIEAEQKKLKSEASKQWYYIKKVSTPAEEWKRQQSEKNKDRLSQEKNKTASISRT